MSYATWLVNQVPSWFQKQNGGALWRQTGTLLDQQRDLLLQAILARFPTAGGLDTTVDPPQETLAPSDALDATGFDRQLPRAVSETPADAGGAHDVAYAARLLAAWTAWKYGGSHYGVLRALQLAGYANMVIVQDNGRFSQLTGSAGTIADLSLGSLMSMVTRGGHPGWMFDVRNDFYSRFAIVFTADASNLSTTTGQAALTKIAKIWKPSKDIYVASYVILAGILLGWPTGRTLGTDPNLGGNSVRTIPGDGSAAFVTGP